MFRGNQTTHVWKKETKHKTFNVWYTIHVKVNSFRDLSFSYDKLPFYWLKVFPRFLTLRIQSRMYSSMYSKEHV